LTSYDLVNKNKAKSKFSTFRLRSTKNLSHRNVASAVWNLFPSQHWNWAPAIAGMGF